MANAQARYGLNQGASSAAHNSLTGDKNNIKMNAMRMTVYSVDRL